MKQFLQRMLRTLFSSIMLPALLLVPASASAAATPVSTNTDQLATRLTNIKTKGDTEIARRLKSLDTLSSKIASTTKLTAADKTDLTGEVTTEITGLTTLRTKLAAETTIAGAASDVQSMVTEYRVYALVTPKILLISTADYQQEVQAKLTTLVAKLQSRINDAASKGKNVTDLQTKIDDMEAKMSAAEAISGSVEQKIRTLEPTDYNNDHGILSGYQTQLKTAHQDDAAALADAKAIVQGIKVL